MNLGACIFCLHAAAFSVLLVCCHGKGAAGDCGRHRGRWRPCSSLDLLTDVCVGARRHGRVCGREASGAFVDGRVCECSLTLSGQVHAHACVCGRVCLKRVTIFDNQSAPLLTPSCKDAETRYCVSIAARALARQTLVTQSLGCTMLVGPFIYESDRLFYDVT